MITMLIIFAMILAFILALAIIIIIKNYDLNKNEYKINKVNELDTSYKNNEESEKIITNILNYIKSKREAVLCVILVIVWNSAGTLFQLINNNKYNDVDMETVDTYTSDESYSFILPFNKADYKGEDYEKIISELIILEGIECDIRLDNILLKLDENKKVDYLYVSLLVLDKDTWKSYIIESNNNDEENTMEFIVESNVATEEDNEAVLKQNFKLKEGCRIFKDYLNIMKDYEGEVEFSLETKKYNYKNAVYSETSNNGYCNLYLADINNGTLEEMPVDYKKDEKGNYIMMKAVYNINENQYEDIYVADLDR